MQFGWFIYTIALMATTMVAFAVTVTVWVLSGRRDCLVAAAGFVLYLLDVGVILFDEYMRMKPLGDAYFDVGLTHPAVQVLLNAGLLVCLWTWMAKRLGKALRVSLLFALVLALLAASALLAPVGASLGAGRSMAYWGFRDCAVAAAFGWGLWSSFASASEAERNDLGRLRLSFGVSLALSLMALAEDVVNILFLRPDYSVTWVSELMWHLTERNLSENLLVVWLAFLTIRSARQTMRVFARHPTHDRQRLSDDRVRPDFEVRLLAYADDHGLSKREREVLSLVLQGMDTQNVASELTISTGTVKAHLHRIYRKCDVSTRKDLLEGFWRG